jgi:hypothetical protein
MQKRKRLIIRILIPLVLILCSGNFRSLDSITCLTVSDKAGQGIIPLDRKQTNPSELYVPKKWDSRVSRTRITGLKIIVFH